jgi:small-conductance mechanosensitive channel
MLAQLYKPLLYLHILAGFLYMFSHGASGFVSFRLRQETVLDRIRALLDLSAYSFVLMYVSLLVMVLAGILLGFAGHWWATGWIWASLILLLAMLIAMGLLASNHFHRLRKAVGLPFREGNKEHPAVDPASNEEIQGLLRSGRPHLLTLIGIGGWAIILYFMVFKPF